MTESPLNVGAETIRIESAGLDALAADLNDATTPLAIAFFAAFETINAAQGRLVVTGMGKSGHIGRKLSATLASTGCLSTFVHPAEASHGDLGMIGDQDCVLALSNSGETPELGDILGYCGRFEIPLMAITSGADSTLAKAADVVMVLPAVPEACADIRAPTTSTTMTLALGDALAVALLTDKGFSKDDFQTFHPGGKLGASLKKVRHIMHADRSIPLVEAGTKMPAAIEELNRGGFGCVGVIENGKLIGIVTDGDIRRRIDDDMADLDVNMIMTANPKSVAPDTLAAEALGVLARTRITALFVVEDGQPVGLIHVHDMLSTGVI